MKINTNSWHYKIVSRFTPSEEIPKTLCSYFWILFFGIIVLIAGLGAALIILFASLSPILVPLINHFYPGTINDGPEKVITGLYAIVLVALLVRYIYNKTSFTTNNVLFQYLKAKKDKVCPLIEYVEKK